MAKLSFELSKEIAGKYKVVNTNCPALHSRIGYVDFRTMTEEQAEALIKAGTSYLVKIKKRKTPPR